jgi:hypothetical protein
VEVDAPGCSYNPDREHHQEIVAAAVAEELQKGLNILMRSKGPPKHVSWQPEADPVLQLQVSPILPDSALLYVLLCTILPDYP